MIYVLPIDEMGCGYYRLIWPVQVLKHHGLEIKIIQPTKHKFFLNKNNRVVVPPDAELVVMQRPGTMFHVKLVAALRAANIAVVIDMDDDMSSIDPSNIAYNFYRHADNKIFSWRYAMEACRQATFITTSTPALQDVYHGHGRGAVLYNCVPAAYLEMSVQDVPTFGWAGNTLSHYNDLLVLGNAAQELVDDGHELRIVGGDDRVSIALRLRDAPTMTGAVPVFNWAQAINEHIGVGLVPLAATKFNRGKSWLKGIEYMAVGVPWVASPREEYRRLQRESGCGLFADTAKQWYTIVKKLLSNDLMRQEQIEAGRIYMRTQTYEAQAWRWAEAWWAARELQTKS